MTKECKQQFTLRIAQANSTELVVILYEMMLCYLEEGKSALQEKDAEAFRDAIRKSRGCLNELTASLHLEYSPAPELLQLYMFCLRRLAYAEVRKDLQAITEIETIMQPLHHAYQQIAPQNTQGPVMNNSQTVYAGLTYGRNTLTENMADQGANRGMRV